MKYTDKLGLPVWDKPETDVFDIEQFNEGMKAIDDIIIKMVNQINGLVIGDTKVDLNEYVKEEVFKELKKKVAYKADKEEIETINSQLDTNTKQLQTSKYTTSKNNKALVSFIDDDGKRECLTILKPILDEKNIKIGIAVNCSYVGTSNLLTVNELKQLEKEGHEILSHSFTHADPTTLTEEQLVSEYENTINWLKTNNFNSRCHAYPSASIRETHTLVKEVTSRYFDCAFCTWTGKENTIPIENYCIKRLSIDAQDMTLDDYKAEIDKAYNEGRWLVFISHAWMEGACREDIWHGVIDYINSKGDMDIVTPSEGFKRVGNILEISQGEGIQAKISKTGKVLFDGVGNSYVNINNTINTPLNAFEDNKISLSYIDAYKNGNPIKTQRCLLLTIRVSGLNYNTQLALGMANNEMKTRFWSGSGWTSWIDRTPRINYLDSNADNSTFNNPPSSYANYTVTVKQFYGTVSGAPSNAAGILTTYKSNYDNLTYQEYVPYHECKKYMRKWDSNKSAWKEWV